MTTIAVMGIVTFLNLLILKVKFENDRIPDLILDVCGLLVLVYIFGGTLGGSLVAMIASLLLSIYLWFFPPKLMA